MLNKQNFGKYFSKQFTIMLKPNVNYHFRLLFSNKKQQSISSLVGATIVWMSCGSSLKSSAIYIVEGKKVIVK